jgi:hypothetical protein
MAPTLSPTQAFNSSFSPYKYRVTELTTSLFCHFLPRLSYRYDTNSLAVLSVRHKRMWVQWLDQ